MMLRTERIEEEGKYRIQSLFVKVIIFSQA